MRKMLIKRILAIIVNDVLFILLTTIFYAIFNCSAQVTGQFSAGFVAFIVVYIIPAITNKSSIGYLCFDLKANSGGKLLAKFCVAFILLYLPTTISFRVSGVQWFAAQISVLISLLFVVFLDIIWLILSKGKCDIGDYLLGIKYNANEYRIRILISQSVALFPISLSILLIPIVGSNIMWFERAVDDFQQLRDDFLIGYFPADVFNDVNIILQQEERTDVLLYDNLDLFINSEPSKVLNVYILTDNKPIVNISKKQDLLEQLLKYIHLKYMWIDECPEQVRFVFLNIKCIMPFVKTLQSSMYYYDWKSSVIYGGFDIKMLNESYQNLCEHYESMLKESLRSCNQDSLLVEYARGNNMTLYREILDSLNALIIRNSENNTLPGLSVSMIPLHLVQEKRDVVISYQIGPSSQSISLDMSEYFKERNAYDSLMFFKNRFEKYLGY